MGIAALPADVWETIARRASLRGRHALARTCRAGRDALRAYRWGPADYDGPVPHRPIDVASSAAWHRLVQEKVKWQRAQQAGKPSPWARWAHLGGLASRLSPPAPEAALLQMSRWPRPGVAGDPLRVARALVASGRAGEAAAYRAERAAAEAALAAALQSGDVAGVKDSLARGIGPPGGSALPPPNGALALLLCQHPGTAWPFRSRPLDIDGRERQPCACPDEADAWRAALMPELLQLAVLPAWTMDTLDWQVLADRPQQAAWHAALLAHPSTAREPHLCGAAWLSAMDDDPDCARGRATAARFDVAGMSPIFERLGQRVTAVWPRAARASLDALLDVADILARTAISAETAVCFGLEALEQDAMPAPAARRAELLACAATLLRRGLYGRGYVARRHRLRAEELLEDAIVGGDLACTAMLCGIGIALSPWRLALAQQRGPAAGACLGAYGDGAMETARAALQAARPHALDAPDNSR